LQTALLVFTFLPSISQFHFEAVFVSLSISENHIGGTVFAPLSIFESHMKMIVNLNGFCEILDVLYP
jgi:hypothetical protein